MPIQLQTISFMDARTAVDAAIAAARDLALRSTIIVLDAGGALVLAARMDGAWAGAFDLALAKARAAQAFAAPSGAFLPLVQPGAPLFGVGGVAGGRYMTLPGGLPVLKDGAVLGAIGVSGGSPDQDEIIARAGMVSVVIA